MALYDDVEGRDWGGEGGSQGGDIGYLELTHVVVQQEPTQCCKTIVHQLKKYSLTSHNGKGY